MKKMTKLIENQKTAEEIESAKEVLKKIVFLSTKGFTQGELEAMPVDFIERLYQTMVTQSNPNLLQEKESFVTQIKNKNVLDVVKVRTFIDENKDKNYGGVSQILVLNLMSACVDEKDKTSLKTGELYAQHDGQVTNALVNAICYNSGFSGSDYPPKIADFHITKFGGVIKFSITPNVEEFHKSFRNTLNEKLGLALPEITAEKTNNNQVGDMSAYEKLF